MRTRLYIAGPCTGVPDHNYPLFNRVQAELVTAGYVVLNPARNVPPAPNPRWSDYMRMSVAQVALCDGVAVLPGWQHSSGASLEVKLANDLGIEHRCWEWWRDQKPSVADIAELVGQYPGKNSTWIKPSTVGRFREAKKQGGNFDGKATA